MPLPCQKDVSNVSHSEVKVVEGGSIQDTWLFENSRHVDVTQLSDVKFIVGSFLKNLFFSYLFTFLIHEQFF